ncbi:hypothetical protein ACFL3V_00195 [Nanoarchaeota archaeon]
MNRTIISLTAFFSFLFLAGCMQDANVMPTQEHMRLTASQSSNVAEKYVQTLPEFINHNAHNLRLIKVTPAECPNCWVFAFHFDVDDDKLDESVEGFRVEMMVHQNSVSDVHVSEIKDEEGDAPKVSFCRTDTDCIPLPSDCHPTECINKRFEGDYQKPEVCTMVFMEEAAYSAEDCACESGQCVNKNLGKGAV